MGAELDLDDVAGTSPLAMRELAALRSQLSALQVDAARYRWLRDGELVADYPYPVMREGQRWPDRAIWFEELDAAIDAAMSPGAVPGLGAIREGGG